MELPKEPHAVSLKVLRLSKPSLAQQYPLPAETPHIQPSASLAVPSSQIDSQFILSPILTLPPAFGTAHVGESFSCALCASHDHGNDLSPASPSTTNKIVSSIRIVAEMQTPSQVFPLEPTYTSEDPPEPESQVGLSVQNVIHFELKEEGNHVLAVNVSYTETLLTASASPSPPPASREPLSRSGGGHPSATGARVRTFRKLYQFLASPCLSVRTKASELVPREIDDKAHGPYGKAKLVRYVLEAQLENVGDGGITLETTKLTPFPPFKSTSLNWDMTVPSSPQSPTSVTPSLSAHPHLSPRSVLQIAFLLEQQASPPGDLGSGHQSPNSPKDLQKMGDGRAVLGQLSIEWRNEMGERGFLSTGNLFTRKK